MIHIYFLIFGCPLCGEKHPPQIHSYPRRGTQNIDGTFRILRVVTIICFDRKENGQHPYTKRFLPPYLIPRSPFFCDGLLALLEDRTDNSRICVDEACEALGCIDPRTVRKHIRYIRRSTREKIEFLARALSGANDVPIVAPEANSLIRLSVFWTAFLGTVTGLFGASVSIAARPLLRLTPSFSALRISTGRAFVSPETRDTS